MELDEERITRAVERADTTLSRGLADSVTAGPEDALKKHCAYLLLAIAGCAAHVTSNLQIDDTAFVPTICNSGQARGFAGVELVDDQQRRLRLAQTLDGVFQAVYFPSGASVGENLGSCGTMKLQNGIAVVNGVRNVEGNATLSCGGGGHTLRGSVVFEGCH